MRFFCFFILSFVACVLSYAQNNEWLNHFGGFNPDNIQLMKLNRSKKLMAVGAFADSIRFKTGTYDSTFFVSNGGSLIMQFNPSDGSIYWIKQIGKGGTLWPNAMSIDKQNNTIIVGAYSLKPIVDPNSSSQTLDSVSSPGVFILKLDSMGNFNWAKSYKDNFYAVDIEVDDNSNVYFSGEYYNTVDFDPGPGVKNRISFNSPDGYLCSLDSNGDFRFVKVFPGGGFTSCDGLSYDRKGNILILGSFQSNLLAKPNQRRINGKGGTDIFLTRMDTSGISSWTRHIGGQYGEYGVAIEIDNSGSIFISGNYKDSTDMDPTIGKFYLRGNGNATPNFWDVFIAKYNPQGKLLWSKGFGGKGSERVYEMEMDSKSNIYVSGIFTDTADFDPSPNSNTFIPKGFDDLFISKFDSIGNYYFTMQYAGIGTVVINSLLVDQYDDIICAGWFTDSIDFDPGLAKLYKTTKSFGSDMFIQKLNQNSIAVGLESNPMENFPKMLSFPNPTKGKFYIRIDEEFNTAFIKIRDLQGQLVSQAEFFSTNQLNLNIEGEKGLYIIELVIDNQAPAYLKVIKH